MDIKRENLAHTINPDIGEAHGFVPHIKDNTKARDNGIRKSPACTHSLTLTLDP